MPEVTVSIRTEFTGWSDSERLSGVRVEIVGAGPEVVTNQQGRAVLNTDSVRDSPGSYLLQIRHSVAAQHTEELAGPEVADSLTHPPKRIYRQLDVGVELLGGYVAKAFLTAGTVHGVIDHTRTPNTTIPINWKPVWIRSPVKSGETPRAKEDIDLIVVHHTSGERIGPAISTFLNASAIGNAHYLIDVDGHVVKLTNDLREANHAGKSIWDGRQGVNAYSIGIEIVHARGGRYTQAQYESLLGLIGRLRRAYRTIAAHRVVGHGDIATTQGDPTKHSTRKVDDPGEDFDWARLERFGLGMVPVDREESRDVVSRYSDIFSGTTPIVLRAGDHDPPTGEGTARLGGNDLHDFVGNPIEQLQKDLETLGFSVRPKPSEPLGTFDDHTKMAVETFQRHFFAGSRKELRPTVLGRIDIVTASWINKVRD
ncbi:N-acetylmuramoyl-L-alanine amidase [Nocardia abscessus]|uniref:N-acetylmuramoyl-L-alanine amidase n=1 Tax=Nocardia abscessus TaxID=120957 RepID=UPI00245856E2|nr:N-acetylmuramoyl-L-alanine amidase [Nocardia abscessus]